MSLQLSDLKLTSEEIDLVSGNDANQDLMEYWELFLFGLQRGRLTSFLILQAIIYFLSLIVCFPLVLLMVNPLPAISDRTILIGIIVISILVWLIINIALNDQAQKWQSWLQLKYQIEKYQTLVERLELLENLSDLEGKELSADYQQQLFQILGQLKASLLLAIKTEQLLRQHQLSTGEKRSFLATLENDLTALMSQENPFPRKEYANLYKDIVEMGLDIYQQTQLWRN